MPFEGGEEFQSHPERALADTWPEYDARIFELARDAKATIDGVPASERWWWLSTQDQIALAGLGKALIADSDARVSGSLKIGDANQTIAPASILSRDFDVAALRQGVRFEPTGKPPLYVLIDVAGVPASAPAMDDKRVSIVRTYYTTDGKPWKDRIGWSKVLAGLRKSFQRVPGERSDFWWDA